MADGYSSPGIRPLDWIAVTAALPKRRRFVLVWGRRKDDKGSPKRVHLAMLHPFDPDLPDEWADDENRGGLIVGVTHWCPQPAGPSGARARA